MPSAPVAPLAESEVAVYQQLRGKRVAMIVLSGYPEDSRPVRTAAALVGEGMQVDYICLRDGEYPRREKTDGIDITRLNMSHQRGGKLRYVWEYSWCTAVIAAILATRSLRRPYDLIYVNNMPEVLVASAIIPKMFGAKVVLDMHDPMPELMTTIYGFAEKGFAVSALKWLEGWSMRRSDFVITVNIACERIFADRSCSREKLAVVMNSPREDVFSYRPPTARSASQSGGKQPFVVMYHGSLVERNGVDLAVEAVARLKDRMSSIVLRIYGSRTAFLDRVLADAVRRGLGPCIEYLGPKTLPEIVAAIESCDIGVIPNHRNAFTDINTPTRIFEYLAYGKPVIAPSTRGITDYFKDDALIFFEAGDVDDLARKIEHAAGHPTEMREIVEVGQSVYLAHTWEKERHTLFRVLANLLS